MLSRLVRLLRKPLSFLGIGGGVFVFGLLLQFLLVKAGMNDLAAFTVQLIITVGLNVELNRRLTWNDRAHNLRGIALSVSGRITMAALSWPLFLLLNTGLHIDGLVANAMTVALGMTVNFVVADRFAFRPHIIETVLHVPDLLQIDNEGIPE